MTPRADAETAAHLDALDRLLGSSGAPSASQLEAALAPLVAAPSIAALPTLASLLLHPQLHSAAHGALRALLPHVLPAQVPSLAGDLAHVHRWRGPGGWLPFSLADLHALLALPHGRDAAWLFWHHRNGHVRQAALQAASVGPEHVPHLLWRVTDHVPAVRDAAAARLEPLLASLDHALLAPSMELVIRMGGRSRSHAVMARWDARWSEPAARPSLEVLSSSGSPAVRRLAALRLLPGEGVPGVERFLRSADVVVRDLALKRLLECAPVEAEPVFRRLVRAPSARVRRTALAWLADQDAAKAQPMLRDALWDRDAHVRAEAQWRTEGADPADLYRAGLAERPAVAARGLGECGAATDVPLLVPLLQHGLSQVRAHALTALAELDVDAAEAHLLAGLGDGSYPVVAEAARLLARHRRMPLPTRVWPLIEDAGLPAVRLLLLRLCARGSHWPALVVLVRALASDDAELSTEAQVLLRRWFARAGKVFTRPSADERAELLELLRDGRVPGATADSVRAWLDNA